MQELGSGQEAVKEVELTIPILPEMELMATRTAMSVAEYMNFDPDQSDEVRIALIEALINAFEHSRSSDGRVYIRFLMEPERLTVIVQDHGLGFDAQVLKKPDIREKLYASYKRGWGLVLIENLMDTVSIDSNEQGTTLTMIKNRQ